MDKQEVLKHYLIAALWSSTDDNEDPLDDNFEIEDVAQESVAKSSRDIAWFVNKAGPMLDEISEENIGHDIWLTRNRHGAGFWDRGYSKEIGDGLTAICHEMGEIDAVVGDDGRIYLEGGADLEIGYGSIFLDDAKVSFDFRTDTHGHETGSDPHHGNPNEARGIINDFKNKAAQRDIDFEFFNDATNPELTGIQVDQSASVRLG